MQQPAPFIVDPQGNPQPAPGDAFYTAVSSPLIASNGALQVIALDPGSKMFMRRGVRGLPGGPVAEKILPHLNELAGMLVANSAMPASEVAARLDLLKAACHQSEPQNLECCVAELDGVRAYVQEGRVILTRQDITA